MDFKNWCGVINVTVITSGVLLYFVPESKLKKSYKGFVSLLTVFLFISPLSDMKSIGLSLKNTNISNELSEESLLLESSNVVLDCAESLLEQRLDELIVNINTKAYCKAHIKNNEDTAYIERIEIYGELTKDERQNITSVLDEVTGGVVLEFIG